jgi:hypothetical protein
MTTRARHSKGLAWPSSRISTTVGNFSGLAAVLVLAACSTGSEPGPVAAEGGGAGGTGADAESIDVANGNGDSPEIGSATDDAHESMDGAGAINDGAPACPADRTGDAEPSGQCGAPPFITVSGTSVDIGPSAVGFVTGFSSLCDTGRPIVVSGEDGSFSLDVSANTPVSFTLSKDCYFDTISGPFSFAGAVSGVRPFIIGYAWKSYFPNYSKDTATILVHVLVAAPPCDDGGVVVRVPGRPDAKVTYPQSDAGTGASTPFAIIGGLAPGGSVTVEGSKPGCTVDFSQFFQTGNVPLVAGAVSVALAAVY